MRRREQNDNSCGYSTLKTFRDILKPVFSHTKLDMKSRIDTRIKLQTAVLIAKNEGFEYETLNEDIVNNSINLIENNDEKAELYYTRFYVGIFVQTQNTEQVRNDLELTTDLIQNKNGAFFDQMPQSAFILKQLETQNTIKETLDSLADSVRNCCPTIFGNKAEDTADRNTAMER